MEEKKTLKGWIIDKKNKVVKFCEDHPDVILTVVGGIASLAGGCIKLYCSKTEYEDHCYSMIDDKVYKIPCKEMKTMKNLNLEEEQ